MKLRTLSALCAYIDEDLASRRRELTTMGFLLAKARPHELSTCTRAAVCLLYAHWEGFVTATARGYLNFIALQGLTYRQLPPNLLAACLRSKFIEADISSRIIRHTEIAAFLLSDLSASADLPWETAFQARSNLNAEVLKDATCLLGLDYLPYAKKELFLDGQLLYYRNRIAHGETIAVDESTYSSMYREVTALLEQFRTDIQNAATLRLYRR